ncbi:MAG: hypothetical protein ACI3VN_10285 [Candidatus Onthomonas sp.]
MREKRERKEKEKRKKRERKEKEVLCDCFVPDNEKYTRPIVSMDEKFVRGLRTFCEHEMGETSREKIVCARQARLHLPGTVFSKDISDGGGLRLSLQFKVYQRAGRKG